MSNKVIYCQCFEPFWIEAAKHLEKEHDLEPCYWIGPPATEKKIKEIFPNVIYHDVFSAIRGVSPDGLKNFSSCHVDEDLLKDLAFNESIAITMMDRMDPYDVFYYHERVRLYHSLLRYWLAVLEQFKPDIVIFPYTPHIVFDYVLYVLCRKKTIKTLIFQATPSFNDSLLFPIESFETQSPAESLYKSYLSLNKWPVIKLSKRAEDYLDKIKKDYSQAMPFQTKKDQIYISQLNKKAPVLKMITYLRGLLGAIKIINKHSKLNYLKRKGRKVKDGAWTDIEYRIYEFKARAKKRHLQAYYDRLSQKAIFDEPYIYCALHYQPEQTTSPMGGVFVDQLLMVDLLSKTIPKGWFIYVREYPWQNLPFSKGERGRFVDFYDDLVALPNVKLIKMEVSPWDIIDNSKAVATVTGTTGWEAVLKGKPALIFGHAWYRGSEGVFYVPTVEKCRVAIMNIEKGFKVDYEKLRLFMYAVEQVCFKGYNSSNFSEAANISFQDNVRGLKNSIMKVLKRDNEIERETQKI